MSQQHDMKPRAERGDNPIENHGDDVLKRTGLAIAFARRALELDTSRGATVGVFGPWGSGKTSFINLARKTFEQEDVPVLDFNPWLFSGAEQLVERFFAELSSSMGMTSELEKISGALQKYGAALNAGASLASVLLSLPQISAIVTKITEAATDHSQPASVQDLRKSVEDALQKHGKRIVVVLDDVDRLSAPEVREVFKLVRLTASFPNLLYVVACDRLRVERALGERAPGLSGRDHLEKIIQWSFNLPDIPDHLLSQQLDEAIDYALDGIEDPGPFDEDVWADVRTDIVRPLIRNMRDVRRYAIAIRPTIAGLKGQVERADVLALEAIRVFLPDVFAILAGSVDALTGKAQAVVYRRANRAIARHRGRIELQPSEAPLRIVDIPALDPLIPDLNKWLKKQVDELIKAAENDRDPTAAWKAREVVESMLDHLFPAGARLRLLSDGDSEKIYEDDDAEEHLEECRVAHEKVFRQYLEHTIQSATAGIS